MVACRIRPTENSVSLNLQRPKAATKKKESEREEDTGTPRVALISSWTLKPGEKEKDSPGAPWQEKGGEEKLT